MKQLPLAFDALNNGLAGVQVKVAIGFSYGYLALPIERDGGV